MKKSLVLLALVCTASLFTACSNDDAPDPAWKQLPTEEISGANFTLTLNGVPSTFGSAQLATTNGAEGTLVLRNTVNGYPEVRVPVQLYAQSDGTFDFSGRTEVSAPVVSRSEPKPTAIFGIETRGSVTPDGKIAAAVNTKLTEAGMGGLAGKWPLSKDYYELDGSGYPVSPLSTTPVQFVWSAIDPDAPNGAQLAQLGRMLLSHILSEVLSDITLSPDGNLTATYYPEIITSKMRNDAGEWVNTQEYLEANGGGEMFDQTSYWIFWKLMGCYTIDLYPRQWLTSPKNLMTWYVKGDCIHLIPNLPQILKQASEDSDEPFDPEAILELVRNFRGMDDAALKQTIEALGSALGIDLSGLDPTLVRQVLDWLETGVPLKYATENGTLKLYVDKQMAAPFMQVVLTFMPQLDQAFQEMAAENPMMGMIFLLLGFDNFTALQTIWAANTQDFELGLLFKTASPLQQHRYRIPSGVSGAELAGKDAEAVERMLRTKIASLTH